jgi:hypothetical protein
VRITSRVLWMPKAVDFPDEYEDAFGVDEERGVAVVADGVSTGMFSQNWAQQLTHAITAQPPPLEDAEAFALWLREQRRSWQDFVDTRTLNYFQRQKLKQSGGAYTTLLWLQIEAPSNDGAAPGRWRCHALGDSGLLHVRGDDLLQAFPIEKSEDLKNDPYVVGSIDHQKDHFLEFHCSEGACLIGDLLVLCTDALLGWALTRIEAGDPPRWRDYWSISEDDWRSEIQALRLEQKIRTDDTTLVLLAVEDDLPDLPTSPEEAAIVVVADEAVDSAACEPPKEAATEEQADSAAAADDHSGEDIAVEPVFAVETLPPEPVPPDDEAAQKPPDA